MTVHDPATSNTSRNPSNGLSIDTHRFIAASMHYRHPSQSSSASFSKSGQDRQHPFTILRLGGETNLEIHSITQHLDMPSSKKQCSRLCSISVLAHSTRGTNQRWQASVVAALVTSYRLWSINDPSLFEAARSCCFLSRTDRFYCKNQQTSGINRHQLGEDSDYIYPEGNILD